MRERQRQFREQGLKGLAVLLVLAVLVLAVSGRLSLYQVADDSRGQTVVMETLTAGTLADKLDKAADAADFFLENSGSLGDAIRSVKGVWAQLSRLPVVQRLWLQLHQAFDGR